MSIKFGTSGWRAIISDEFTFDNVRLVTQAIANYVKQSSVVSRPSSIIVGYDTRFLSKEFAQACAEVLAANAIKVLLCERDTPTPVIAYQILKNKTNGGINFTASHNLPEYNGIKFSFETAAPAPVKVTNKIEEEIRKLQEIQKNVGVRFIEPLGLDKSNPYITINAAHIKIFDPKPAYLSQIKKRIKFDIIKKAKLKIAVDCLYGTSRDYLDLLLKEAGCKIEVLHNWLNPYFGGKRPEPAEENIQELIALVREKRLNLGLSCDGDADRFGIVDRDGTVILPNQVISLLLYHLIKTRPIKKGAMAVRTVATTHMVDAICKKFGLKVYETPVGFKYFTKYLIKENCIIAGEESGGLSIGGYLPEKDGILACLLIAEMVAMRKKSIRQILGLLYKEFGYFQSERIDLHLTQNKKDKLMGMLINNTPKTFADRQVLEVNKKDGCKLLFKDDSWVLFRPSGTEPIVRCYFEAKDKNTLNKLVLAGKKLTAVKQI